MNNVANQDFSTPGPGFSLRILATQEKPIRTYFFVYLPQLNQYIPHHPAASTRRHTETLHKCLPHHPEPVFEYSVKRFIDHNTRCVVRCTRCTVHPTNRSRRHDSCLLAQLTVWTDSTVGTAHSLWPSDACPVHGDRRMGCGLCVFCCSKFYSVCHLGQTHHCGKHHHHHCINAGICSSDQLAGTR